MCKTHIDSQLIHFWTRTYIAVKKPKHTKRKYSFNPAFPPNQSKPHRFFLMLK